MSQAAPKKKKLTNILILHYIKLICRPTGTPISEANRMPGIRTAAVALAWFGLNGVIGLLYYAGIIDEGIRQEKLCQHKTQLKSLWKKYGPQGG